MENHIDWAGDVAWLTDGVVTSCLTEKHSLGGLRIAECAFP